MEDAAKAFAPMIKQILTTVGEMSKASYERYGEDSLPIISEVMSRHGSAMAEISKGMVQGEGMVAAGQLFGSLGMFDVGIDLLEVSDDTVHFKIAPCPYRLEGTSMAICEAMMLSDKKMVETISGERVEMEIPKTVALGDDYCEVIFKKK